MIKEITMSNKLMKTGGMMVLPIPKKYVEAMSLQPGEMIEAKLKKLENLEEGGG